VIHGPRAWRGAVPDGGEDRGAGGISSFFSHATGAGLRSHVGLKLLRVERPQLHLMVDKDGGRTSLCRSIPGE